MACTQTLAGLVKDCAPNMGGIAEVFLANRDDVSAITETTGKVTAITMASSAKFKKYAFRRETGSFNSNRTIDIKTGVNYVVSEIAMVFNRMEQTKRVEVEALAKSELIAMVKDCNGVYWLVGDDEPLLESAGDGLTGTARGDRNGYAVTLQCASQVFPKEILVGTGGVDLSTIVG